MEAFKNMNIGTIFDDDQCTEGFFFDQEKKREVFPSYADIFTETPYSGSSAMTPLDNYLSTKSSLPSNLFEFNPNTELMDPVKEADDQISKESAYQEKNSNSSAFEHSDETCQKSGDINDALHQIFSEPNLKVEPPKYKTDLAVRKDVVNKNILRIISRYFKEILSTKFPQYKQCFKSEEALDQLFTEFSENVFPTYFDSDLKYTLGAFVLAPKMKVLTCAKKEHPQTFAKVSLIHKTLSKYTHKDLKTLLNWDKKASMRDFSDSSQNFNKESIKESSGDLFDFDINCPVSQSQSKSISMIFAYFYSEGMDFFNQQETVQKHKSVYFNALEELKKELILDC